MAETTGSTVVGVFDDRQDADRAIDDLRKAGFRTNQIGVITRDAEGKTVQTDADAEESHVAGGAVAGAGVGGLVGLGVLAGVIPVLGPAIAAGTLATILTNAAGGAAIASLAGALIGWGIPEEHAQYYDEQLKAGRIVVTVHAGDRSDQARMILNSHRGYSRESIATTVNRR
ncbi:MAG: general stress protein [Pirellulaceae bacterium]